MPDTGKWDSSPVTMIRIDITRYGFEFTVFRLDRNAFGGRMTRGFRWWPRPHWFKYRSGVATYSVSGIDSNERTKGG